MESNPSFNCFKRSATGDDLWKRIAATEAFPAYYGDYVIIDSKFNFLAFSFDYG